MRALVVYESMFGNTRVVAEEIADALDREGLTTTVTTAASTPDPAGYDLVVVGAPTHAHRLPQPSTRTEAAKWAERPDMALTLEPAAGDAGVREWLTVVERIDPTARCAAFSTRVDMPRMFTGDASAAIVKKLERLGARDVERQCFLVSFDNVLVAAELARAEKWAVHLATPTGRGQDL